MAHAQPETTRKFIPAKPTVGEPLKCHHCRRPLRENGGLFRVLFLLG